MTTKSILMAIIVLKCAFVFSQVEKKVVGFFDGDNLSDTLYYKDLRFIDEFRNKDIAYSCKISGGNGKKYEFNLGLGHESLQFSSPKIGYIEIYQWKTGSQGFEQYETYKFNSEYDTWILQKIVTENADGKEENYIPEKPTSIDGTEFKSEKPSYTGNYYLSNDSKRFSIMIKQNGEQNVFEIFDKGKKISSGIAKVQKVKEKDLIFLNDIEAEYKSCGLIVKNIRDGSEKQLHFTQYKNDYLTFKKAK